MNARPGLHAPEADFLASFPRRAFLVEHGYEGDERLTLEALLALSEQLPPDRIEYNLGDLSVDQDPDAVAPSDLTPQETLRRIATAGSWLVLKNIERVPAYRDLLEHSLASVRHLVEPAVGPALDLEGFVFVSSPGSVTPFHTDPEHNFLLQLRGSKQVHIWDPADRAVVTEAQLEAACAGAHRNLPYAPSFEERGEVFTLAPGVGLHFPVQAPHWVQNGPEVSISYSFTFRSRASHHQRKVRVMNAMLRRAGGRPRPVGASARRDAAKVALFDALQRPVRVAKRSATVRRLLLQR